jgi:hypothetical protein
MENPKNIFQFVYTHSKPFVAKVVNRLNTSFNDFDSDSQKQIVVLFMSLAATCSLAIITSAFKSEDQINLSVGNISYPQNINSMNDKERESETLIPIGKMKGEADGHFDSFYVAVDKEARIFINRDISYTESAYKKSEQWEEITRTQLNDFERKLHFLPLLSKQKSLKP